MSESDPRPRSVTVVVEWDNVRLSELGRARRMLAELDRQAEALARAGHREWQGRPVRVDIVLVFDSHRFDEATVRQAVADSSTPGTSLPMRLLPSHGASYYEQKNAGAAAATGEVVVFLDSDVVPEDGWLESILRPFALPWVQCAAGNSYVETGSVYEKAFALTWFFPLRDHDGRRGLVAHFYANNVAFRRDFFSPAGFRTKAASRGARAGGSPIRSAPRAARSPTTAPRGCRTRRRTDSATTSSAVSRRAATTCWEAGTRAGRPSRRCGDGRRQ